MLRIPLLFMTHDRLWKLLSLLVFFAVYTLAGMVSSYTIGPRVALFDNEVTIRKVDVKCNDVDVYVVVASRVIPTNTTCSLGEIILHDLGIHNTSIYMFTGDNIYEIKIFDDKIIIRESNVLRILHVLPVYSILIMIISVSLFFPHSLEDIDDENIKPSQRIFSTLLFTSAIYLGLLDKLLVGSITFSYILSLIIAPVLMASTILAIRIGDFNKKGALVFALTVVIPLMYVLSFIITQYMLLPAIASTLYVAYEYYADYREWYLRKLLERVSKSLLKLYLLAKV